MAKCPITDLYKDWIDTIESQLTGNFKESFYSNLNKMYSANTDMVELNKELQKITLEKDKLNQEKDDAYNLYLLKKKEADKKYNELAVLQGKIDAVYKDVKSEDENIFRKYLWISYPNEAHQIVLDSLKSSNEMINILSFEKIKVKFNQLMSLSLNASEKRSALMQFYAIDWHEIGIDLPMDKNIWNISISWWVIDVWSKLLK